MEFCGILDSLAFEHGDSAALAGAGYSRSYAELVGRVHAISGALSFAGFGAGSRIVLIDEGGQNYIEMLLAAVEIGAEFIPISVLFEPDAVCDAIEWLRPDCVFAHTGLIERVFPRIKHIVPWTNVICFTQLRPFVSYRGFLKNRREYAGYAVQADNPVVSVLKNDDYRNLETLSYGGLCKYMQISAERESPAKTAFICIPYATAEYIEELCSLLAQGVCVYPLEAVSAKNILYSISRRQAERIYLTPSLIRAVRQDARYLNIDFSGVKALRLGQAYLDRDTIGEVRELFSPDCLIVKRFGFPGCLTELAVTVAGMEPNDRPPAEYPVNSVGKATGGISISAFDPDGRELPGCKSGRLFYSVDDERPRRWRDMRREGWISPEGYVFLDYSIRLFDADGDGLFSGVSFGGDGLHAAADGAELSLEDALGICDDFLPSYGRLGPEELGGTLMAAVLRHLYVDAAELVVPKKSANISLVRNVIINEITLPEVEASRPEGFYLRSAGGVSRAAAGEEGFPRGMHLLYYPIIAQDKQRVGELYLGLKRGMSFSAGDGLRMRLILKCLSSVLRQHLDLMESRTVQELYRRALDLISDGVGITDIRSRSTLIFVNKASTRHINMGKTNPAFGALLEESQTRNMYNLSHDEGLDRSSGSFFYLDEGGRKNWANYAVHRVSLFENEYAITISNVQEKNITVRHMEGLLSAREIDILDLLTKGLTNKEAAAELSISENTVKSHINHIYRKLNVNNRSELISCVNLRRPPE